MESDQLHDDSHLTGGVRFRVGDCTVRPWEEPAPSLKRFLVRSKNLPEAANNLWPVRRRHDRVRAKRVLPNNAVPWLVRRSGIAAPGPSLPRRLAPRAQSPSSCGTRAAPPPDHPHRGPLPPRATARYSSQLLQVMRAARMEEPGSPVGTLTVAWECTAVARALVLSAPRLYRGAADCARAA